MSPWHRVARLTSEHDLTSFTCGDLVLDGWIQKSALSSQAEGSCGVHMCVNLAGVPQAYFSLAMTKLTSADLPASGNKRRDQTPAIVLAKLGLDEQHHGKGVGSMLIAEVLRKAVEAADTVGGSYLIADVPNQLRHKFYEKHDFTKISSRPNENRFYMKMSSARQALTALDDALANHPLTLQPLPV